MSNGLLTKLIASRSESFMKMAEFVRTHQGSVKHLKAMPRARLDMAKKGLFFLRCQQRKCGGCPTAHPQKERQIQNLFFSIQLNNYLESMKHNTGLHD